jgi:hypothetical protein
MSCVDNDHIKNELQWNKTKRRIMFARPVNTTPLRTISMLLFATIIGSYSASLMVVQGFVPSNHLIVKNPHHQQFSAGVLQRSKCEGFSLSSTAPTAAKTGTINDFRPKCMTINQSMVFFLNYLVLHRKEQAIKRNMANPNSIRSKLWPSKSNINDVGQKVVERLRAEVKQEQLEKKPFIETLKLLNESRKEMIELVGYDANLLVSCFSFAMLAALMNSIIPHYYSQAVNCLANAMTSTRVEVMASLTGLGTASVLCALFTGIRGALFWLAGMYIPVFFKASEILSLIQTHFFNDMNTKAPEQIITFVSNCIGIYCCKKQLSSTRQKLVFFCLVSIMM